MLFLKSLIFLPANMLVAFLIVSAFRHLLFYPQKEIYIYGKHLPLTPGILVKYHKLLIDKINGFISDFLHDIETDHSENKINILEEKAFEKCYKWAEVRINSRFLPEKILTGLRVFVAEIGREFISQFLRTFVPFMMEKLNFDHYVDLVNHHFTIENIKMYYDKYIYRYSLYIMCGFALIIGITNQIIYLIMGG